MARSRVSISAVVLWLSVSAAFSAPPSCIRPGSNARIVWNGTTGAAVRVYFRSDLAKTEHYIDMTGAANNRYWAVLPKPNDDTKEIVYRIVTVDAKGSVITRQEASLAVETSCAAVTLTPGESKFAAGLVIGSDVEGPQMPVGFRCDGVVGRITANELQAFNACAEEALAVAAARQNLIGAPPAQKVVVPRTSAAETLQGTGTRTGGLSIGPLHHRTPRRAPLPPTPPQPRLSEPVSPSRP